jgi:hypothetical protein
MGSKKTNRKLLFLFRNFYQMRFLVVFENSIFYIETLEAIKEGFAKPMVLSDIS